MSLKPLVVLSAITISALALLLATSLHAHGARQQQQQPQPVSSSQPSTSGHRMARQQRQNDQDGQTCHLRELDLCLAPIAVFTQSTNSHPVTNSEINRQCKMLLETDHCLKNYTQRCLTDSQGQFLYMFADGGLDLIRDLCKSSSKMRSNYLKHGDCINVQQKGQRVCIRDFQVSLERANDIGWQNRLKLGCCAFNRLNACIKDVVEPKCGTEAWELHSQLFRATFSRLPTISCAKYDHSSKGCAQLLPAAGESPKGSRSHSALSKLLSAYTGN